MTCFAGFIKEPNGQHSNCQDARPRPDESSFALQQHFANVFLAAQLRNQFFAQFLSAGGGGGGNGPPIPFDSDKAGLPHHFDLNRSSGPFTQSQFVEQKKLEVKLEMDEGGDSSRKERRNTTDDPGTTDGTADRGTNERFSSNGSSSAITA